jgi:hypothetical protein
MRTKLAAVLFVLTGAFLLLAGVIAANVFGEYKDSEDSFYLAMASMPFVLGLVCLAAGVWALRGPNGW